MYTDWEQFIGVLEHYYDVVEKLSEFFAGLSMVTEDRPLLSKRNVNRLEKALAKLKASTSERSGKNAFRKVLQIMDDIEDETKRLPLRSLAPYAKMIPLTRIDDEELIDLLGYLEWATPYVLARALGVSEPTLSKRLHQEEMIRLVNRTPRAKVVWRLNQEDVLRISRHGEMYCQKYLGFNFGESRVDLVTGDQEHRLMVNVVAFCCYPASRLAHAGSFVDPEVPLPAWLLRWMDDN